MSTVYFIIGLTVIIALVVAFVILLLGKAGLRDCIIMHSPKLISELFGCDFCLSFWLSLILASILALILAEPYILLIPIISSPISRFLL